MPSGDSLTVEVDVSPAGVELHIVGVLTRWTSDHLRSASQPCLSQLPAGGQLWLNLAGCTFCDSTAAGELVTIWKHAQRVDVVVRLINTPNRIARTLAMLGVSHLFN